jgi:hypothetical protein
MTPGPGPKITAAQVASVLQWLLALGLALGLNISTAQEAIVLSSSSALAIVLTAGDAYLRHSRHVHLGHLAVDPLNASELADMIDQLEEERRAEASAWPVNILSKVTLAAEAPDNGPQAVPGAAPMEVSEQAAAATQSPQITGS